MFRIPDHELECPLCKSKSLSSPTVFDNSEGSPHLYFELVTPEPGIFGATQRRFRVGHGRVCMACGHVALSLRPGELEELKSAMQELRPDPGR
jgi:hypothetical protein